MSGGVKGFFIAHAAASTENFPQILEKSQHWLPAVRAGTAGIIIDNSNEGAPYQPRQGAAWHRSFSEGDLPAGRFVFITQDRRFARDYKVWCDQNGIAERVAILNYDYHLKRFFAEFEGHGAQHFARRLEDFAQKRSV